MTLRTAVARPTRDDDESRESLHLAPVRAVCHSVTRRAVSCTVTIPPNKILCTDAHQMSHRDLLSPKSQTMRHVLPCPCPMYCLNLYGRR